MIDYWNSETERSKNEKERVILNKIAKRIILSALSLTTLFSTSAFAADLSGWALSEYQAANQAGLVSYSVVANNMKDSITREEFCELAVNLYKKLTNEDMSVPAVSPFTDTDSVAVAQAYFYGIVSGTSDTTFTPDRLVTRQEMAKMIVSTLTASQIDFILSDGSDEAIINNFADGAQVSGWAKDSVITMLNYSLMSGETDSLFNPLGSTTREQAVASVSRSYNTFGDAGYSVTLPEITLSAGTLINQNDFDISWTAIENAVGYHLIVKNERAESVLLKDVYENGFTVTGGTLAAGHSYTVTVGAILPDASEVFSMPVDFTYNGAPARIVNYEVDFSGASSESNKQYLANNPKAQQILDTAAKYLGVPYLWGGTTPSGFDCSGFAQYVYRECGYNITRTTYTQWDNDGSYVTRAQLQPGDLVYFGTGDSPSHVGIYVGDGMMIHAPSTGKNIQYTSIDSSYYASRTMGGKRIL